jgi:VRR-NUC domain
LKESEIQKQILDYLKLKRVVCFKHRNVGIKKPNGSFIPLAFGEKGINDVIGCLPDGRFLAIEVKRPSGRPTLEQREFIANVNRNNGVGIIAYSLQEVIAILE